MSNSQTWLITGASSGLGFETAKATLAAGHQVIACCRDASKNPAVTAEIEKLGGHWLQLDLVASDVEDKIRSAIARYGKIDVLVNNAGYAIAGSIEDTTIAHAQALFATNFYGPLRTIQAVLPSMRARRAGTIINISSGEVLEGHAGIGVYSASKHAIEGLTESLSLEIADFDIRVLLVEPGFLATNFVSPNAVVRIPFSEPYVGGTAHQTVEYFSSADPSQAGDPAKAALRIVEAVYGTGMLKGREVGLRLPVGSSGADMAKKGKMFTELAESTKDIWQSI